MRNCSFFATLIIFLFLSINVEAFYESTIDCKYLSIEKRKKLICDDGRLLKLSCVDGDWSTQNSLCVGSKPIELKKSITSTNNVANRSKKYVAVVISGQLGRVEIKSKLKFLLGSTRPIPIDVELQLFLIVGNQKLQFSKGAVRVLQSVEYFGEIFNGKLQQLIDLISQQSIWPLVAYQYNQTAVYETEYPTTSDWYLEGDESRSHRGATHVLQFDGLLRAEMLIEAFERKHERRFDYVLRLRDDALLLKPLSWNSIFRRLENSDTVVPRCISHGGVNDHVAFFKRKALNAMFSKPLDLVIFLKFFFLNLNFQNYLVTWSTFQSKTKKNNNRIYTW